jgi:hypothetical protein
MLNTDEEWVGFQDHDKMFLNHHWHGLFESAIKKADNPGLITCMTNRVGCPLQRVSNVDRYNHDIFYHRRVAENKHNEFGDELIDITDSQFNPSALVFTTSKKAWKHVGGFDNGFLGVDTKYAGRLKKAGYKIYMMPGLYVYHWYRAEQPKKQPDELTEKIKIATNSGKYFITVSYDTEAKNNIAGIINEEAYSNDLQHYWIQTGYENDNVTRALDHIKEEFKNKKIRKVDTEWE